MRDNSVLLNGLKELNIELNEKQLEQFENYYDLLIEKNKVMNLTAITEYEDVLIKHFLDSLSIASDPKFCDLLKKGCRVLDIGTGAGFPGIPLKIAFPNSEFVLMDSLNKRIVFLNEVISALGLDKISAIHARCEELARKDEYRQQFDLSLSRAVAKLNSLSEMCVPFVKTNGYFVSYKSGNSAEEIQLASNAFSKLSCKLERTIDFNLPGSDYSRSLVVIKKTGNTPLTYPRMGGKILDKPL